jgi:hypothetical protein
MASCDDSPSTDAKYLILYLGVYPDIPRDKWRLEIGSLIDQQMTDGGGAAR